MTATFTHIPVMLPDMIAALSPRDGQTYIDGTFGAGGYTRAILESADCKVIAFDRDPEARARYDAMPENLRARCRFIDAPFADMADHLDGEQVDGVVLDLGVSSPQIDDPARGFSFRFNGPLDMRMDPRVGASAADVVNNADETDLANIIYDLGEDRKSRSIARAIVAARKEAPITTTQQLASIVRRVVRPGKGDTSDPCTRTFQALRLFVNNELDQLQAALRAALTLLQTGGRLVVVSFHSLEDRIVKRFLQEFSARSAQPSRHIPVTVDLPAYLDVPQTRAQSPSDDEARANSRSRSAHLRCAIRTTTTLPPNFCEVTS
jgi:16S rRNA (cytosine1402-N4)-methyltransferase